MPLTVLVTLDGSTFGERILGPAARIATEAHALVYLLRVIPPARTLKKTEWRHDRRVEEQDLAWAGDDQPHPQVTEVETVEQAAQRERADALAYLQPLGQRFPGAEVRLLVREGDHPADEVLRCAAELQVDLIAMATHGRGGLAQLLTGSVAEAVMRAGKIPVLLYRPAD